MSLKAYLRVSSEAQDYAQQNNCLQQYFKRNGIAPSMIESIVVEKISGTVKHTERKLAKLLQSCKSGDTIYVSELSRLGRNMSDLYSIVTECCERQITIIQCKDGAIIENESIGGKALLFALSLAAEIEVANIRQRTKMGLDARRQLRDQNGYWISNSGNMRTHFGREKGCDLSEATAASAKARTDSAADWRNTSEAYAFVRQSYLAGKSRKEILSLFDTLHQTRPEIFCTRQGGNLTPAILSKWISEMQIL